MRCIAKIAISILLITTTSLSLAQLSPCISKQTFIDTNSGNKKLPVLATEWSYLLNIKTPDDKLKVSKLTIKFLNKQAIDITLDDTKLDTLATNYSNQMIAYLINTGSTMKEVSKIFGPCSPEVKLQDPTLP